MPRKTGLVRSQTTFEAAERKHALKYAMLRAPLPTITIATRRGWAGVTFRDNTGLVNARPIYDNDGSEGGR